MQPLLSVVVKLPQRQLPRHQQRHQLATKLSAVSSILVCPLLHTNKISCHLRWGDIFLAKNKNLSHVMSFCCGRSGNRIASKCHCR